MTDKTDQFGKILESYYGEPHPQSLHIDYFFLLIGTKIVHERDKIIEGLQKVGTWIHLETEWPELLLGKFPILLPETERQQEERLNQVIRKVLLDLHLLPDPHNPPHFIVSRACKYNKQVVKHSLRTREIESVLMSPTNQHLDYFYLMIKPRDFPSVALPRNSSLASHIPGDWMAVEPEADRPLKFIGYFPKLKPFEMEREREWRLNEEVRIPFKKYLGSLLSPGTLQPQKLVTFIMTRACKYTDM